VPLVPGTVGGVSGWFELDTGSRAALTLFAPYLAEHPALRSGSHGTGTLGYGVGGGQIGGLGYVSSMRIGAFDFTNMYTNFSQAAKGALADPDVSGNIGGGVWKQFTLTLDYPHMRIGLQPNGTFNTPVAHDRSGLFVINKGGKVVVLSVFDGSPAAKAGIVAGDTIVEVGDESVKGTDLSAVRERFMQPPATKLRVVVETQGANRPVELTLAEYF
jgi:membrane-associated protease RseP (regulator of RpoE activity)